jgi:hypothetical protein
MGVVSGRGCGHGQPDEEPKVSLCGASKSLEAVQMRHSIRESQKHSTLGSEIMPFRPASCDNVNPGSTRQNLPAFLTSIMNGQMRVRFTSLADLSQRQVAAVPVLKASRLVLTVPLSTRDQQHITVLTVAVILRGHSL